MFFYRHKLILFNIALALVFLVIQPAYISGLPDTVASRYYFGIFIILALFFEFAGIYYKYRFLYSKKGAEYTKIPFYISLSFFPRVAISGYFLSLAFREMGLLDRSDFALILIVVYATFKEFWVRSTLLNPEGAEGERGTPGKAFFGDVFLFLFSVMVYIGVWKIFLLDNPRYLLQVMHPSNYVFVAPITFFVILAMEMPLILEEYMKPKRAGHKWIAVLSGLLPTLAVIFQLVLLVLKR